MFLTKFASRVTIAARGSHLTASRIAQEKALGDPKIEVRYRTTVKAFYGDTRLTVVVLQNHATGDVEEIHPAGVFVFIGLQPNTAFLRGVVELNEGGFIITTPTLETSLPGVFAAGDARQGSTKQLINAAGEGASAALMIRQFLQGIKEARPTAAIEHDSAMMAS